MRRFLAALLLTLSLTPASAQFIGGGGGGSSGVNIATGCQATGGTITQNGTIYTAEPPKVLSAASAPIPASDCGSVDYLNTANNAATIGGAGTGGATGFTQGWFIDVCSISANPQTLTPGAGTIAGGASYVIPAGVATAPKCFRLVADAANSNYVVIPYTQVDIQVFTNAGTSTWNGPTTYSFVRIYGCGQGGGGGGGIVATSSTPNTASGGGGGGGAECHEVTFLAADVTSPQTVTINNNANGGSAGSSGTQGGSSTFGALATFLGGGGGGPGLYNATSNGGSGASSLNVGLSNNASGTPGCAGMGAGGAGVSGIDSAGFCGGGGGGGNIAAATGRAGGSAVYTAPGGESGAGVLTGAGQLANNAAGGKSTGCANPPTGGSVLGGNGGAPVNPDKPYHPGCGGAAGAGNTTGTGGSGTAGTSGGGGGGGGTVGFGGTAGGAGAQGGKGFVVVQTW